MFEREDDRGNGFSSPRSVTFWDVPTDCKSSSGGAAASTLALKAADLCLFVFDRSDHQTWIEVTQAWQELRLRCQDDNSDLPRVLLVGNFADVGTKCVFDKEVERFVKKRKGVEYVEASARTGDGVLQVERKVLEMLLGGDGEAVVVEQTKMVR